MGAASIESILPPDLHTLIRWSDLLGWRLHTESSHKGSRIGPLRTAEWSGIDRMLAARDLLGNGGMVKMERKMQKKCEKPKKFKKTEKCKELQKSPGSLIHFNHL